MRITCWLDSLVRNYPYTSATVMFLLQTLIILIISLSHELIYPIWAILGVSAFEWLFFVCIAKLDGPTRNADPPNKQQFTDTSGQDFP